MPLSSTFTITPQTLTTMYTYSHLNVEYLNEEDKELY